MSVTTYSLGAAQEVTGSKHILEIDGRCFMIESPCFFDNIKAGLAIAL